MYREGRESTVFKKGRIRGQERQENVERRGKYGKASAMYSQDEEKKGRCTENLQAEDFPNW
jgi:hypothetical protein